MNELNSLSIHVTFTAMVQGRRLPRLRSVGDSHPSCSFREVSSDDIAGFGRRLGRSINKVTDRAGLRHVRSVRPHRAANFKGPPNFG